MPTWAEEAEEDQEELRKQNSSRCHQETSRQSQGGVPTWQSKGKTRQDKMLERNYLFMFTGVGAWSEA